MMGPSDRAQRCIRRMNDGWFEQSPNEDEPLAALAPTAAQPRFRTARSHAKRAQDPGGDDHRRFGRSCDPAGVRDSILSRVIDLELIRVAKRLPTRRESRRVDEQWRDASVFSPRVGLPRTLLKSLR